MKTLHRTARRALAPSALALLAAACSYAPPRSDAAPAPGSSASSSESTSALASGGPQQARWGMVIHGGAGNIRRESLSPEREAAYRAGLERALQAGYRVLERGGSSLDAVEAAVNVMEDDSLFNAGRGAVFTADGRNELDAAIMDGATLNAGAVAGLRRVKNPVDLARAVMERSPHVMLIGEGAEAFARQAGVEMVPESYFRVESRWQSYQRALEQDRQRADSARRGAHYSVPDERKFGTVGAVALDKNGNLAAATSTGGTMMKRWGRVGDVPVIGAGTYADNRSCAVSATGTGEYFIRNTVARSICALVQYAGLPLAAAADSVVMRQLAAQRGDGGIIAMDRQGNWTMPFNTSGMYRGRVDAAGRMETAVFR